MVILTLESRKVSTNSLTNGTFSIVLDDVIGKDIIYCSAEIKKTKYGTLNYETIPFFSGMDFKMHMGNITMERQDNRVLIFGKVVNQAMKNPLPNAEIILKYWDFREEHLAVAKTNIRGNLRKIA
jgi:hypothetical protein